MSIRKQYDSDLESLKAALVEMGQNAAEAVENALEALCTADTAAENHTRGSNVLLHVEFGRVAVVQRMSAEPDNDRPLFHIRTFQKCGSDVRNRTNCQNVQGRV